MIEKKVKDFSESIYNTNQSREFVMNFFDKYLHADMNKISYKAKWDEQSHTMEIFVECLDNVSLYAQNEVINKKK
jgi:hypothetical protein